jgi:hypothetical protein
MLIEHGRVRFGESPWSQPMGLAGGGGLVELPNVHDLLDMAYERKYIWPDWPAALRVEFRSRLDPAVVKDLRLVIEDPQTMRDFQVNGKAAPVSETDWWLDRQFRTVPLVGGLRPGLNQVDCRLRWVSPIVPNTLRFRPDGTEIENVYLVGDFHVRVNGTNLTLVPVAPLPGDPKTDLTRCGLPFYVGTVRYELDLELTAEQVARRATLAFARPGGEGLRLTVNGQAIRDLWCEPFAADCTAALRPGRNRIQVDLFTTLGNLLGLLHHRAPWSDPAHAYDRFFLRPLGLCGVPGLVLE